MRKVDVITWFVPPSVRDDPRKTTRHKGIAKSMLAVSLGAALMLLSFLWVHPGLPAVERALFIAAIVTPALGALLIRETADITLGLVTTNIAGIVILAVWAFVTGGIMSVVLPIFLANIALLSTFGNVAILVVTGTFLLVALVLLYLATVTGLIPESLDPAPVRPALMLLSMLCSIGGVVLVGIVLFRERADVKARLVAARDAAEQASRAKSVFLTSMSHELRTPLNAVLGFAELIRSDAAKPLDREQSQSVGHILNAGQYLLGLVTQVLDMSRIEAGGLTVKPGRVRVDQIIAPCLSMVELEARRKGIALVDDCGGCAGSEVQADLTRAKQVLLNLLSNAVRYNRDGGTVRVACAPAEGGYLRIGVSDTGAGIPGEKQGELFEPFSRLGAEAGTIQGAGLGLAIAKRLTELMQGRIGFESVEGKGSTFWVELRLAQANRSQG